MNAYESIKKQNKKGESSVDTITLAPNTFSCKMHYKKPYTNDVQGCQIPVSKAV